MSKKKTTLNARQLRVLLSVMLLVVFAAGIAGISAGLNMIKDYSVEVEHKKTDAEASDKNLAALQNIEKYLQDNQDVRDKAKLLRSDGKFPEFRIVDKVRAIASKNNVKIGSFSYGTEASSETGGGAQTPAAAPAAGGAAAGGTTSAASTGKTIALTETISKAKYKDFLQFTYDLEQFLPKMKISGIDISSGSSSSSSSSSGGGQQPQQSSGGTSYQPVTIEMYVR